MNKSDLVSYIAEKVDCTKIKAEDMVEVFMEGVTNTLKKGNSVVLTGFGTFSVVHRKARMARNPRTGEDVKVVAKNVPKFKAGKKLKESVL